MQFEEWASAEQQDKHYYMKIRTTDMQSHELQERLQAALPVLKTIDDTFAELYPITPVLAADYMAVLMNDMGERIFSGLEDSPFTSVKELSALFLDLKTRTLRTSARLAHSDALAHNIVLNVDAQGKKKLVFVDWDEGTVRGRIMERQLDKEKCGQRVWIADLMYPNGLRRQKSDWYTRVQLAAALISLLSKRKDLSKEQDSKLKNLIYHAEILAKQLATLTPVHEPIEVHMGDLYSKMAALDQCCDQFLSDNS